ncbi:MAG: AAA family ATPase [Actinobacteria bacterium]|nr:AAA family ATPase [Actinomycetota bacterium]
MRAEGQTLSSVLYPLSPLTLQIGRANRPVVGRPSEMAAVAQELEMATSGKLSALTVEGEPGIGKTRILMAASDEAKQGGFGVIAVASDEEIRGPFLLARSIVGNALEIARGNQSEAVLERSLESLSGRDDPGFLSLPGDQKLLRALDLAASGLRSLASEKKIALFIDDLQWADDDSLRLLRYTVRAAADVPFFLMMAIRPEELAFVNEAVNLIADMERLGLVRRLKMTRFTPSETAQLLEQILPGKVESVTAATMHSQAEGVPFVVEELAQTYRDAAMIQELDGVWRLAKNADRLVPSAVRTLISRRAARVPEETKSALAQAAVLGRHFSLKDLAALKVQMGEEDATPDSIDRSIQPAVATGLLLQHSEDSPADYGFAHEHVREYCAAILTPSQRKAIHSSIVELLMTGDPAPQSLALLAHHAKAAGDAPLCMRFSLDAIHNALSANAPEEVLRVVELALPMTSTPQHRVEFLQARDQALDMLRRSNDRLEGLAELAALAEALGDTRLAMEVQLRRSAALRLSEEWDQAAELAEKTRQNAAELGDRKSELSACMELGQALLQTAVGEAYSFPTQQEFDTSRGEEAYERVVELAEELGDDASLAAALRELGVVDSSKVRGHFVDRVLAGEQFEIVSQVLAGTTLPEILRDSPVAADAMRAQERLQRSLELFEKVGDRRGAMSAIIAMAYFSWGPDIHFGSSAGRHIEEIRRLSSRLDAMTKESERSLAEAQMLYGAHVFSRAKIVPDLAISRGEAAYRQARLIGDRMIEFMSAGGTAMAHLDLGEYNEAKTWLDRAAATAAENPTPVRARQLELWRGLASGAAGDAASMRNHLERAVHLAAEQGRPAARCEALALFALETARLGVELGDEDLLETAERAAGEVKDLMPSLPGRPPWGAQADAAMARVSLKKGAIDSAVSSAREAIARLLTVLREDAHVEILVPVAEAITAGGTDEEKGMVRLFLRLTLIRAAQRTVDEEVRVRWLRGPIGQQLARLAGPLQENVVPEDSELQLHRSDSELLALLVEGLTNKEIAERLGLEERVVSVRLSEMLGRIGASSRAEATAFAFREQVV